ncbi:hypothetical protein L914_17539 [Phytophthora nicotianae]|uniref:Uncharacterized protein n=1 Tax=Phytophthora nicotianae TaxID=4792 RepID=W2MJC2_PHYNI|nr:hypothetical protein L914_17539 [Phytophthora nicotianae]
MPTNPTSEFGKSVRLRPFKIQRIHRRICHCPPSQVTDAPIDSSSIAHQVITSFIMQHTVSASHHSGASSSLDACGFVDASTANQDVVDACKRRNGHSRARSKRQQCISQMAAMSCTDQPRSADVRSQDPAAFAQLLADHFVARESSIATVAAFAKPQQLARPVAGSVGLGSFRSWQFGERCLATYRVLFGRPLWSVPTSPRPRKRKYVTPPTSSSSDSSTDVDEMSALELEETTGELLPLPTVDELLELPTDETFASDGKTDAALDEEDVLAGLSIDLGLGPDADTGEDSIDLLWELDTSDVDGGTMLAGGEEELRFLAPDGEDMEDV